MTGTFQIEVLSGRLAAEIEMLAEGHGKEFTYHREVKGAVCIDWAYYFQMQKQKAGHVFTARVDGKLVGYVINFYGQSHHYDFIGLSDDTFYLAPEYRGPDFGLRFILAAEREREATRLPILKWVNKVKADFGPLWEKMGYVAEEIHYTKVNPKWGTKNG